MPTVQKKNTIGKQNKQSKGKDIKKDDNLVNFNECSPSSKLYTIIYEHPNIQIYFGSYLTVFTISDKFSIDGNLKTLEDKIIHIYLSTSKNKEQLVEKIDKLNEILHNLKGNCVSCLEPLEFQCDDYSVCGRVECQYIYEELNIGSPVVEKYQRLPEMVIFNIESALQTILSNDREKIFYPYPNYFCYKNLTYEDRQNLLNNDKSGYCDFQKLTNIVKNISSEQIESHLKKVKSDDELEKIIGLDTYMFIRFIVVSSTLDVRKTNFDGIDSDKCSVYEVTYQEDNQNRDSKTNNYLFHGSKIYNWFSILRNGLKDCSKTSLMRTGAAYGNGVYLSSSFSYALNYGTYNKTSVVGVFEILDDIEQYKKSHQIYVVPNEKKVVLRYILFAKNGGPLDTTISKQFNIILKKDKEITQISMSRKTIKRLHNETKKLRKDEKTYGYQLCINDEQFNKWRIIIHDFPPSDIKNDMEKFGVPYIEMEITFPDDFPFNPPFVRIISPRFKRLTGHITSFGALCMEVLTSNNWVPSYSLLALIITIKTEIIQGEGRLDPHMYDVPYNEKEALESFYRVSRSHGWM